MEGPPNSTVNSTDFLRETAHPEKLSPTLRFKILRSIAKRNTTPLVPVIVVFDQQPAENLDLQSIPERNRSSRLAEYTREQQSRIRAYLRGERKRNRARAMYSYWVRNAIAVEAAPETIVGLTKSSNVAKILYDHKVHSTGNAVKSASHHESNRLDYINLDGYSPWLGPSEEVTNPWGIEFIEADRAVAHGVTGSGINVSVVDTGIDAGHPAFGSRVIRWNDFTSNNCSNPCDPNGHGTHVAGTIAGEAFSGQAVGVAPDAQLFGARVLGAGGSGRISDVLAALEWSANQSADVISVSLGITPITTDKIGNRNQIQPGQNGTSEFRVFSDGSVISGEGQGNTTVWSDGFQPAGVLVRIEPTKLNGSDITANATAKAAVLRNMTVWLENENGSRIFHKVNASWQYSGRVPPEIGHWKFTPTISRPLAAGNWTLQVKNGKSVNISYQFRILTIYPTNGSSLVERFVNDLTRSHSVITVIAAGNSGHLGNRTLLSPGAAKEAVTVGATGFKTANVAPFSSRGPVGYYNQTRPGVDVIAPGKQVQSTIPKHRTSSGSYKNAFSNLSGTSMATPHVSGTIALILAANSSLSPAASVPVLRQTASPAHGAQNEVGSGVVNAWAAVRSVRFTSVIGRVVTGDSDFAANDTILLASTQQTYPPRETNATGWFTAVLTPGVRHNVTYYQISKDGLESKTDSSPTLMSNFPRDGSVDIFAIGHLNTSATEDIGNVTLPPGHVVNVTVVNQTGAPVENASVRFKHHGANGTVTASFVFPNGTNAHGQFEVNDPSVPPGFELAGNVSIQVKPPTTGDWIPNQTRSQRLNVTKERSISITLQERVTCDPLAPSVSPPTDLDNDGVYEDVNGNNRSDFQDIVILFEHQSNATAGCHDFNENGRFDFDDIVSLFEEF